jgi:predicted acyl esterase
MPASTGWHQQPQVSLNIRRPGEHFTLRGECEWPIARTRWTKYYLQPDGNGLGPEVPAREATLAYATAGGGITFLMAPMEQELEITGPVAAKIWLSSDSTDADVFLALRVFDPGGKEVTFIGSNDPRTPVGLGWLRASHRKLDPNETLPYRPWHSHDEAWPMEPGKPAELDIEIWPTSIVVPPGHRLALTVRGKDYEVDGSDGGFANAMYPMKGVGPFTHTDPSDRPPAIFGGTNMLHFAVDKMPYLLLPIIP